jgi:hypothetical protein
VCHLNIDSCRSVSPVTVDTSEAGLGDIDVIITHNNTRLPVRRQLLTEFCQQFVFVPIASGSHLVTVMFNDQNVKGN